MVIIDNVKKYYEEIESSFVKMIRQGNYEKVIGGIARFGTFGLKNIIKILDQNPEAIYVNSMRGWNYLGRYVVPGAKGYNVIQQRLVNIDPLSFSNLPEDKVPEYYESPVYESSLTKDPDDKDAVSTYKPSYSGVDAVKYSKGLIRGVNEFVDNISSDDKISNIIKSEINNIYEKGEYGIENLLNSIQKVSVLIANDIFTNKKLDKYPELKPVITDSVEYIICERFLLPKRVKINIDTSMYSDYQIKDAIYSTMYSVRAMTQKCTLLMQARAHGQAVEERFEKLRNNHLAKLDLDKDGNPLSTTEM